MKKLIMLVSMAVSLMIGSSAMAAWTEDFEGSPDLSAAPWSPIYPSPAYGSAFVGAANGPNVGNSMNYTDFVNQQLDLVAIGEDTVTVGRQVWVGPPDALMIFPTAFGG